MRTSSGYLVKATSRRMLALVFVLLSPIVVQAQQLALPELERARTQGVDEREHLRYLKSTDAAAVAQKKTRELLDEVFKNSPAVRQAEYVFDASLSDRRAAQGAKLPQVLGTVQSSYAESNLPAASRPSGKPSYTVAGQLVLFDWGRLDALVLNREALADAAQYRIDLSRLDLTVEVLTGCLELEKQQSLLKAAKAYTQKIEDLTARISKVAESDPGRASELSQTESRVLQARSSEKIVASKIEEIALRLQRHIISDVPTTCAGIGASFLRVLDTSDIATKITEHPQLNILGAQYRSELATKQQLEATLKPQLNVRLDHTPLAAGLTNEYQQSIALQATALLFDGNTLKSNAAAAQQRAYAAQEQRERSARQLRTDLLEKNQLAQTLLTRAEEYVVLLEVNQRVRDDFFIQWAALGRRTLFELLAIEAEQFSLRSGYYTSLYDAMINYGNVRANLGLVAE